jgi:UDP-N-acetylmuramate dehydrogenase
MSRIIIPTHIRDVASLFSFLTEVFYRDGVDFSHPNLDALEEIIRDWWYTIGVENMRDFLLVFGHEASRAYWGDRYDVMGPTLWEMILDIGSALPRGIIVHHPVGQYTGYQTRVQSAFFIEITSPQDLTSLHQAYIWAREQGIECLMIGGGTNILWWAAYYPWLVIRVGLTGWDYDQVTQRLRAASWEKIWNIAESLEQDHDQDLWHRFIGLPGSIWGAVTGNAGCFGLETESNLVSVDIYDMVHNIQKTLSHEEMQFSYRSSILKDQRDLMVLTAEFDLSEKREKYSSTVDNIYFREHQQPKGYSCGSFFKNPTTLIGWGEWRPPSAGALIEQVGLKGYRHGGARWSELHANFLLSDGPNCRCEDLVELVRLTQDRVQSETWYVLIPEVRIV